MKREFLYVDVVEAPRSGSRARIPILTAGKQKTRKYGWIEVTNDMLSNFKTRFEQAGQDLCLDYDHGTAIGDSPDDRKAAGWIKEIEHVDGVLYGLADLTPAAAQYLADREYRYASAEWNDEAEDTKTGEEIGPALQAVAITNRPVWKGLPSIEVLMSERAASAVARQEQEETNVKTFNLSEFGGPKEAELEQAVTFLAEQARDAKKALSEAEKAAATAVESNAKLVVLAKELKEERDARRAEAKERFFSEHRTKIGKEERETLEPIYDSGEDGPAKALAVVKMLPVKFAESPRGSGGTAPAGGSATQRFLAECDKVMREEKTSFTQASKTVGARDPRLLSEYRAEVDRVAQSRPTGHFIPSGEVV